MDVKKLEIAPYQWPTRYTQLYFKADVLLEGFAYSLLPLQQKQYSWLTLFPECSINAAWAVHGNVVVSL